MGYQLSRDNMNQLLLALKKDYKIYAPVLLPGQGRFSNTDLIGYGEINCIEDVVFDQKSYFSPKEVFFPITQTLFYFTEDEYREPQIDSKDMIILLRSCDIHAVTRLDKIMLENGPHPDSYYFQLRSKLKLVLLDCPTSFDNCFCVSMGTQRTENYSFSLRPDNGAYLCDVKEDFANLFASLGKPLQVTPQFVQQNNQRVSLPEIPENFLSSLTSHKLWDEYKTRCIACGRCNTSCPTCSCFTMQDLFYEDNPQCGERRRVWASCQIDGFTDMAGGHSFRQDKGQRMRFKVLHKVYDFKKRFGLPMCVGCGRCDDVCPEYISFASCVNKLSDALQEVQQHV